MGRAFALASPSTAPRSPSAAAAPSRSRRRRSSAARTASPRSPRRSTCAIPSASRPGSTRRARRSARGGADDDAAGNSSHTPSTSRRTAGAPSSTSSSTGLLLLGCGRPQHARAGVGGAMRNVIASTPGRRTLTATRRPPRPVSGTCRARWPSSGHRSASASTASRPAARQRGSCKSGSSRRPRFARRCSNDIPGPALHDARRRGRERALPALGRGRGTSPGETLTVDGGQAVGQGMFRHSPLPQRP